MQLHIHIAYAYNREWIKHDKHTLLLWGPVYTWLSSLLSPEVTSL